jgi:hypothetical protein
MNNSLRQSVRLVCSGWLITYSILLLFMGSPGFALADQKNQGKNNGQEKKDDARVQNARQDVNQAASKIQAGIKDVREAEGDVRKLQGSLVETKREMDATEKRLEDWVGERNGLSTAVEAQRKAQQAYDEAAKTEIASMKTNPKFAPLAQRVEAADKAMKDINARQDIDGTTRQSMLSPHASVLSDWRYAVTNHLETVPKLKELKSVLASAQAKVAELRLLIKKQVEVHPDLKAAQKKWEKAKSESDKAEAELVAARRQVASDNSKLAAEKMQLSRAMAQDRQNDGKKNNNNNKNKNNNRNKNNKKN